MENPEQASDLQRYSNSGRDWLTALAKQSESFGKYAPDLIGYYPFNESESLKDQASNPIAGNGRLRELDG